MEDQLESALDLMRRMPPNDVAQSLGNVIQLVPDLTEDLLETVDQPLKVATCAKTGKPFLLCDYNRDGDSFRSPWSNEYQPALPDGATPGTSLRKLEVSANDIFASYAAQYYKEGNPIASAYFWELDEEETSDMAGFAACILIKSQSDSCRGAWDSIHVVEVAPEDNGNFSYKLTTTIILSILGTEDADSGIGPLSVSGTLSRQSERIEKVSKAHDHLVNVGNLIQDQENKLRGEVNELYFGKAREVTSSLRSMFSKQDRQQTDQMRNDLAAALAKRASVR